MLCWPFGFDLGIAFDVGFGRPPLVAVAVGGADDDHALILLEPVHFRQKHVDSLIGVRMAGRRSSLSSDRIDLIDKNHGRSSLFRGCE